jgi:hypothetical protein
VPGFAKAAAFVYSSPMTISNALQDALTIGQGPNSGRTARLLAVSGLRVAAVCRQNDAGIAKDATNAAAVMASVPDHAVLAMATASSRIAAFSAHDRTQGWIST